MSRTAVIREADLRDGRVQVESQLDVNLYVNHIPTDVIDQGVDDVLLTGEKIDQGTDDVVVTAGVAQSNTYEQSKIIYG